MRVADISTLYDYHFWATGRILDTATLITDDKFRAPRRFPLGSLHRTLVHTLGIEIDWLDLWQENLPSPSLTVDDLPDLATIRERWHRFAAELRAYLATRDDRDLDRIMPFTLPRLGLDFRVPLWNLMLIPTYHGAQHRSEAAQILTECGRSPGNLDIPFFLNGHGI